MKPLFDFGISQEDPRTEQNILDIQSGDRILSVASGGEVPLTLLALNERIHITAVDVSPNQIRLCRLKLISALKIPFPLNAKFLGYTALSGTERLKIFRDYVSSSLNADDSAFWESNREYLEKGIAGSGRFEQYIRKMRIAAHLIIGSKNLIALIRCKTLEDQNKYFQERIATRKSLQWLFKIAFHPKIYRKRGLREQALIHAREDTGKRFYSRFDAFCTGSLASENYFLQYFMTGNCSTSDSYPDFLKPENRNRLISNSENLEFKVMSFQDAIREKERGYFNKIHFSNLGDWMDSQVFNETMQLLLKYCNPGTRICYRFLQKDHFALSPRDGITDEKISEIDQRKDRFPFYTTFILKVQ